MSISMVVVAKDEEKFIKGCVEPLVTLVDEVIVVLDSRTTDNTGLIAEKMGCRVEVFEHPNTEVFRESIMRNKSLSYAKSPWILLLDCDERIEPEEFWKLEDKIQSVPQNTLAIHFPRFEYIGLGKWATVPMLRLIRNNDTIRFNNLDIHTSMLPSIRAIGGTVEGINVPIHHLDVLVKGRTSQKRAYYTERLHAQLLRSNLQHHEYSDAHLFLGLEYTAIGNFDEAERHYKEAIQLHPTINWRMGGIFLAQNYLAKGDIRAAEEAANEVIRRAKQKVEPASIILAEVALRENDIHTAIRVCSEALELNPLGSHLHINLAALMEDRDPDQAINHLERALKLHRYLEEPVICRQGQQPNLFCTQSSFLSNTKPIFEHFEHCYSLMGCEDKALYWSSRLEDMIGKAQATW